MINPSFVFKFTIFYIKTHGRVSVAKKVVQCTNVLFAGTANSPFSTPHISITAGLIPITLTYVMPSIYVCDPTYQI